MSLFKYAYMRKIMANTIFLTKNMTSPGIVYGSSSKEFILTLDFAADVHASIAWSSNSWTAFRLLAGHISNVFLTIDFSSQLDVSINVVVIIQFANVTDLVWWDRGWRWSLWSW